MIENVRVSVRGKRIVSDLRNCVCVCVYVCVCVCKCVIICCASVAGRQG